MSISRILLPMIGVAVVLYGAADVSARLSHATFGASANTVAFAPAISAFDALPSATAPTPTSVEPLIPARLVIASIGVDAPVVKVGKKPDGSMEAPSSLYTTGWYSLGSQPGASGSAVIAGHVNNALTKAGVFEHLDAVSLGDTIVVADAQGRTLTFAVHDIEDYPINAAPLDSIFATQGPARLVIITCAGDWDPRAHSYDHRLVIFADLVSGQ